MEIRNHGVLSPLALYNEFCLCTGVGMSAKWGVPVPKTPSVLGGRSLTSLRSVKPDRSRDNSSIDGPLFFPHGWGDSGWFRPDPRSPRPLSLHTESILPGADDTGCCFSRTDLFLSVRCLRYFDGEFSLHTTSRPPPISRILWRKATFSLARRNNSSRSILFSEMTSSRDTCTSSLTGWVGTLLPAATQRLQNSLRIKLADV